MTADQNTDAATGSSQSLLMYDRTAAKWIIVALALLVMAGSVAYDVIDDRANLITHEQDRLMTQVRVIEANLASQIEPVSLTLRSLAKDVPSLDMNRRLSELSDALPGARTLLILDKAGKTVASNRAEILQRDFSDRDYFTIPRKQQKPETLYVSPPFKTVLNKFVINLSVIIPGKDGSFNGVVGASLDPDYFKVLLGSVLYADGMWSTIMHGDGLMFMIIPERNSAPGTNMAVPGTFFTQHTDSGKSENIFIGTSYLAGTQRIVALRTFNPPQLRLSKPLIIAVSRDRDAALAGWWRDTTLKCSSVFLSGGFLILGTLFLQRRQKTLDQHQQQLFTEQIIAQQEAQKSRELLKYTALIQGILESTSSAVFSVDAAFRYTSFNSAHKKTMKALYGSEIDSGHCLFDYMSADDARVARANLERSLTGDAFVVEAQSGSAAHQLCTFEISHNPIRINDGTVSGVAVFARDVTERKQAEAELQNKNKEVEQFIYTVSHDLRSPLVTIKTFLGYLELDLPAGDLERAGQDMQYIRGAADKMELLLNELMEMSRIGRIESSPVQVTFHELASEALATLAGPLNNRKVYIDVGNLNPTLYGDRPRLAQLWQNLLENAVKYLGNQIAPRIGLGCEEGPEGIVFFVRDNGIGIALPYHDKIFGLFEKLDSTVSGAGLGLSMVKRIVELYGGRIWVESEGDGQGTCFRFTLPKAVGTDHNRKTR